MASAETGRVFEIPVPRNLSMKNVIDSSQSSIRNIKSLKRRRSTTLARSFAIPNDDSFSSPQFHSMTECSEESMEFIESEDCGGAGDTNFICPLSQQKPALQKDPSCSNFFQIPIRGKPRFSFLDDDEECPIFKIGRPLIDTFIPFDPCDHCIDAIIEQRHSCFADMKRVGPYPNCEPVRGRTAAHNVRKILHDVEEDFFDAETDMRCAPISKGESDDDDREDDLEPSKTGFPWGIKVPSEHKYVAPDLAPRLTENMISENEQALKDARDNSNRKIKENITGNDLLSLENKSWVHDRVVDYYMNLIRERSRCRQDYPNVYAFQATFYAVLQSRNGQEKIVKTTGKENIFLYDLVFFPVCEKDHWRLVVINFQQNIFVLYNSLKINADDKVIMRNIEQFLQNEYARKHDNGEWEMPMQLNTDDENIPHQDNGDDCGVFMLQFAEYLSRQQEFNFEPKNIPYFRQRMIYEIMKGRLLIS